MELQNNKALKLVVAALILFGVLGAMIYIQPETLLLVALVAFFSGVMLVVPAFGGNTSKN